MKNELPVLNLHLKGICETKIAIQLGLNLSTVQRYLKLLRSKSGAKTIEELRTWAYENALDESIEE